MDTPVGAPPGIFSFFFGLALLLLLLLCVVCVDGKRPATWASWLQGGFFYPRQKMWLFGDGGKHSLLLLLSLVFTRLSSLKRRENGVCQFPPSYRCQRRGAEEEVSMTKPKEDTFFFFLQGVHRNGSVHRSKKEQVFFLLPGWETSRGIPPSIITRPCDNFTQKKKKGVKGPKPGRHLPSSSRKMLYFFSIQNTSC